MGEAKRKKQLGFQRPIYHNSDLFVTITGLCREYLNNEINSHFLQLFTGKYNFISVEIVGTKAIFIPSKEVFSELPLPCLNRENVSVIYTEKNDNQNTVTFRFYDTHFNLIEKLEGNQTDTQAQRYLKMNK